MSGKVGTDEVTAFRLAAHHLTQRLGHDGLLVAAGGCAVQDSPPGSALLALHARVRDVTQEQVAAAVAEDKTLLQTWCMRGAPYLFPTHDAPVFTTGVLPPTAAALHHFLPGLAPALGRLDLGLTEAVELCGAEISSVLSGRRLAIDELGAELAQRIAGRLTAGRRSIWEGEGPYAPGQPLGEGVVHFCIRILTLQRIVCFAPRAGNEAQFVLVEEWLGPPIPDADPDVARAELVRRYLRCYGPSTRAHFAAWIGVNSGDTGPWWDLVEDELSAVDFRGTSWLLTDDLDALRSAPQPEGVRLLPPHDPYTQARDRDTIVEQRHHRELWKPVGDPGAVLTAGTIAGTWRPRKRGQRLTITITAFHGLSARDRQLLEDEGQRVARLRGASSAEVVFDAG